MRTEIIIDVASAPLLGVIEDLSILLSVRNFSYVRSVPGGGHRSQLDTDHGNDPLDPTGLPSVDAGHSGRCRGTSVCQSRFR